MELDNRLRAVADFVKSGHTAADIGTDHGYLAIALVEEGKCSRVIAVDKNEGPFLAACRTVQNAGMEKAVEVRLGDGLQPIMPGEASVICIAGMGGQLMKTILQQSPLATEQAEQLVLQPMNGAGELRRWLYESGWHISSEFLAEADGKLYEIISAEKGSREMPSDIQLEVGPCLMMDKPPLFRRHVEDRLAKLNKAINGMSLSPQAQEDPKYLVYKKKASELEELL